MFKKKKTEILDSSYVNGMDGVVHPPAPCRVGCEHLDSPCGEIWEENRDFVQF